MDFHSLPTKLKEWLSSDTLTYININTSDKFQIDLKDQSVIPIAIYDIATKKLGPENFINHIQKQLKIAQKTASEIARVVLEKALKPIEGDLLNTGVDIRLITQNNQSSASTTEKSSLENSGQPTQIKVSSSEKPETQNDFSNAAKEIASIPKTPTPPPVDLRNKPLAQSRPELNPSRPTPVKPAPASDQPFILHRESGSVSIPPKTAQPASVVKPPSPPPTHPQTVNLRAPSQNQTPAPAPKPPAPTTQPEKPKEESTKRTVHYSGPVTKIE